MSAAVRRQFAHSVVLRLQQAGFAALWAGGCVRDMLLNLEPDDYDIATSARPEEVRTLFGPRKTLAIGESFGVVQVRGSREEGEVEVATFRQDGGYVDGRRPVSVSFTDAEQDAQRRDFTINGMFYDPVQARVIDYVGGQADLAQRIVRAIGDPVARFREDKLRMLRAVRMAARFQAEVEPATKAAIQQHAPEVIQVSAERIAQELHKVLTSNWRVAAIRLAGELHLLQAILPELRLAPAEFADATCCQRSDHPAGRLLLRLEQLSSFAFPTALACLLLELPAASPLERAVQAKAIARRLRLSNEEQFQIASLIEQQDSLVNWSAQPPHLWKPFLSQPLIDELLAFLKADRLVRGLGLEEWEAAVERRSSTPREILDPPPLLTGQHLIAAGYRPGRDFKAVLEQVRNAQLDGELQTCEAAMQWAQQYLASR